MAFTVEDGTGVAGANSYQSVVAFKAYHDDRGNDHSSYTDTQIEQALVRAADYIDKRWGPKFRGFRQKKSQGLEWPRLDAFDDDDFLLDDVPEALQKAHAEYAFRALTLMPLAPDPDLLFQDRTTMGQSAAQSTGGGGQVVRKSEKVDDLEEATTFAAGGNTVSAFERGIAQRGAGGVVGTYIPTYPEADLLMRELIRGGASRRLGRA